jgi:hypothetical protein
VDVGVAARRIGAVRALPARAVFLIAGLVAGAARAQAPAQPPPWPLLLEATGGVDTPLGLFGGVVTYVPGPRLSLGAGVGVSDAVPGGAHLHLALLGRLRLIARSRLSLALVVAGSRASREHRRIAERPPYATEISTWRWRPGWRIDGGLEASLDLGSWVLRLGAGLGYVLNRPRLDYEGPCGGPSGPVCGHYQGRAGTAPGQLAPTLSASAGWRVGQGYLGQAVSSHPTTDSRPGHFDPRSDSALLAPSALTPPARSLTLTFHQLAIVPHLQASYGVHERVQALAGLGVAFPDGEPLFLTSLLKARLFQWRRLHLAALGGYAAVVGRHFSWQLAGAGPLASVCFDQACRSLASASLLTGAMFVNPDEGDPYREYGAIASGSVIVALHRRLKLLGEIHVSPEEPLWVLGVRLPLGRLVIDLGVAAGLPLGSLSLAF